MRSVLIADDDPLFRSGLGRTLRARGLRVQTAGSSEEALEQATESPPEWAVIDLFMPDLSGLDLLRELRRVAPSVRAVVVSGYSSVATAVSAMKLGAVGCLAKPVESGEIVAALERDGSPRALTAIDPDQPHPSLARVEWEHLNRVVTSSGGNITTAARRLGIDRRTLQRKLRKRPPSK